MSCTIVVPVHANGSRTSGGLLLRRCLRNSRKTSSTNCPENPAIHETQRWIGISLLRMKAGSRNRVSLSKESCSAGRTFTVIRHLSRGDNTTQHLVCQGWITTIYCLTRHKTGDRQLSEK